MTTKPEFCQNCPINHVTEGYVPLLYRPGSILMVGEAAGEEEAMRGQPFIGGAGQWLKNLCRAAQVDLSKASIVNVIGCRPPNNIFPGDQKWSATTHEVAREGVRYCRAHHLEPALERCRDKSKIISLGGRALESTTERSGISVWRGSPLPQMGRTNDGPRVIPTLHPAYLMRQAKLASVVIGDLRKTTTLPPENYILYPSLEEVEAWQHEEFAFDFEWDHSANISLCGLSDRLYSAIVVPFQGLYIGALKRIFENARSLIGHNIINADMSWFEKLGWKLRPGVEIHDTMLKQHLVQPDFPHDLGFVASVFTNKVFWKGKGWEEEDEDGEITVGQQWRTWDKPNAIPRSYGGYGGCTSADEAFRLYNGRDTDAEFQINGPLSRKLKQYELENCYWNISVPVAYICREIGERGFKIDTSRFGEVRTSIDEAIAKYESQLPVGLRPYEEDVSCNIAAPKGTYRAKSVNCKGTRKTPHELCVGTISRLGDAWTCPQCGRTKQPTKLAEAKIIKGTKKVRIVPYNSPVKIQEYTQGLGLKDIINLKTGQKTTGSRARKLWGLERTPAGEVAHPEFTLLTLLKEKVTLRTNFAKDSLMGEERMFFNLKVHGTAEGRLSSSGRRRGIDLNIQNQPEEFRIIYVPDYPEWAILNSDIVQGENWLTAWLAKDWERWERLQSPGYDEHGHYATEFFKRPCWKGTEGEYLRHVGKIINHMLNYGASWKKLQDVLMEAGFEYSAKDCKDAIVVWKKVNAGTARWQQEVIGTTQKQGFLRNPFGRQRWFSSRDYATKALAFLPASTLADMVLRMMIAHFPDREECWGPIQNLKLGVFHPMVEGWRMSVQVHDSLVNQGPKEGAKEQSRRTEEIMCQEWPELNGFHFKVETKYSEKSWGEVKKYD